MEEKTDFGARLMTLEHECMIKLKHKTAKIGSVATKRSLRKTWQTLHPIAKCLCRNLSFSDFLTTFLEHAAAPCLQRVNKAATAAAPYLKSADTCTHISTAGTLFQNTTCQLILCKVRTPQLTLSENHMRACTSLHSLNWHPRFASHLRSQILAWLTDRLNKSRCTDTWNSTWAHPHLHWHAVSKARTASWFYILKYTNPISCRCLEKRASNKKHASPSPTIPSESPGKKSKDLDEEEVSEFSGMKVETLQATVKYNAPCR